jgi:hypothetical protein
VQLYRYEAYRVQSVEARPVSIVRFTTLLAMPRPFDSMDSSRRVSTPCANGIHVQYAALPDVVYVWEGTSHEREVVDTIDAVFFSTRFHSWELPLWDVK